MCQGRLAWDGCLTSSFPSHFSRGQAGPEKGDRREEIRSHSSAAERDCGCGCGGRVEEGLGKLQMLHDPQCLVALHTALINRESAVV